MDAVIDHEAGFMASREVADVYATEEPQAAFHARVAFCLDVHNEVRCKQQTSALKTRSDAETGHICVQHGRVDHVQYHSSRATCSAFVLRAAERLRSR